MTRYCKAGSSLLVLSIVASAAEQAARHSYDNARPEEPGLARTLDGRKIWTIEARHRCCLSSKGGAAVRPLREALNFRHPDFAMTLRFTDTNQGSSLSPSVILFHFCPFERVHPTKSCTRVR